MNYTIEYFHPRIVEEVLSWPVDVLADYTRLLKMLMEFGPDLRMPHSRALGEGLFELRPRGSHATARGLYCFQSGRKIVILHAFAKKSQQTPDKDLRIARKRLKEISHA